MTIVTKPLTDEKKKDLKPLVVIGDGTALPPNAPVDGQDSTSNTGITVYQHPYRKHRTGFLVCLTLLVLLTLGCAVCGGVYLYYRFTHPSYEAYRDRCTIRFTQPPADPYGQADAFIREPSRFPDLNFPSPHRPQQQQLSSPFQPARNRHLLFPSSDNHDFAMDFNTLFNSFQQDFELDLRRHLFEILQIPRVPQLGFGRPARFIHDFSLNLTGILDMESRECYVMPLNRTIVKPPQDLYQFLQALNDGTYTLDTDAVSRTYYIDPIPISNITSLGRYIAGECNGLPAYRLVSYDETAAADRISFDRTRRDVGADNIMSFGEFAGKFHTLHIVKR